MDMGEVFRAELCLERESLLTHKKCMQWLPDICPRETSGKGLCERFYEMVFGQCVREMQMEDGDDGGKFCTLLRELGAMHPDGLSRAQRQYRAADARRDRREHIEE